MDHPTLLTQINPQDTRSIDGLVTALYASVSGPAGPRDWYRLRNLFLPLATLARSTPIEGPRAALAVLTIDQFLGALGPQLQAYDYREQEIARRVERFGHIAHVFSTYEVRQGAEPQYVRGINSLQLFWDGDRWWISSMIWDDERSGPIPDVYLEGVGAGAAGGPPGP